MSLKEDHEKIVDNKDTEMLELKNKYNQIESSKIKVENKLLG